MSSEPNEVQYGEDWAPHYDQRYDDVDPKLLDFLVDAAGPRLLAVELGVGTGRVAIPLAARGISVTGVDLSPSMLEVLRSRDENGLINVIEGDMAEVPVNGEFPLICVVANSFFMMLHQERQLACFRNVASHLEPGGRFVLECFVPDMTRYGSNNTNISVLDVGTDGGHTYDIAALDPVNQRITSHHVSRSADGETTVLPVVLRYAWPAELDLMAKLAGLTLEARYGGFDRSPFTEESTSHVSVYRRASQ
jgi:SAM-dependent methyltransferase